MVAGEQSRPKHRISEQAQRLSTENTCFTIIYRFSGKRVFVTGYARAPVHARSVGRFWRRTFCPAPGADRVIIPGPTTLAGAGPWGIIAPMTAAPETMPETIPATRRPILPLRLRAAEARRRGKRLVGPVDLELGREGFTIVMGPNGAGKTTLLRLMHGLERLAAGEIRWAVPMREARMRQAYVFQTPIMMRRSVVDSIAYPLRLRGLGRAEARARAARWAGRIGLAEALERPATVLSGGEKQKLSLARALITGPEVLFLDEPCASLDGRAMREIEALLRAAQEGGTRIVMATHDMGQACRLASDVVFLYGGRVHECGPAEAFFNAPRTPEAAAFLKGDIVE